MHHHLYPTEDTYITNYSGYETKNFGLNEVLRIGTSTQEVATLETNWVATTSKFCDRSILKFNLSAISASIADGEIVDPKFKLTLKVCNEYQLPNTYSIYAFPVSQSWMMGNGYFSDGGSDVGVSWFYTDKNQGTPWVSPITSSVRPIVDFLNNPGNATGSFNYGGGTWYYTDGVNDMTAKQDFEYTSDDISMDVTDIVMAWISGSLPNNGFILISSDEVQASGSGFSLSFYGRDTNTVQSPYLDIMWDDSTWTTGSVVTSSVTITSSYSGVLATAQTGSIFTMDQGLTGSFSASLVFTSIVPLNADYNSFLGMVYGQGLYGDLEGYEIIGNVSGYISVSSSLLSGSNVVAQTVSGSFLTGDMEGTTFNGFYHHGKIVYADVTGSWPSETIDGAQVTIPLPSGVEPYAFAYVDGPFIQGKAFGVCQINNTTSASFFGQLVDGSLQSGVLNLQLSGSVSTSSFQYTSSVEMSSSVFQNLDVDRPFTVIIKNLQPTHKAGDMVRVNVFGRRMFPVKTFEKASQITGYLVPELLPSSSFYAIKDNMSEEIVVDFDNYTRISCEYPEGNFFYLDTTGLAQERPYRLLVRVESNGSVYTFDNGDVFKITR